MPSITCLSKLFSENKKLFCFPALNNVVLVKFITNRKNCLIYQAGCMFEGILSHIILIELISCHIVGLFTFARLFSINMIVCGIPLHSLIINLATRLKSLLSFKCSPNISRNNSWASLSESLCTLISLSVSLQMFFYLMQKSSFHSYAYHECQFLSN